MLRKFLPAAAATLILVGACATITAQTNDGARAESDMSRDDMSRYTEPGPEHDLLDGFRGDWVQSMEFRPEPGAEPQMLSVENNYHWVMGGRFIQGDGAAYFGGDRYKSRAVIGFDTFREEYTFHHIDNMSTAVLVGRGKYDAASKTLTLEGKFDRVSTNERDQAFRQSWQFQDDGTIKGWYEVKAADGKMFKLLQSTWSRPE